MLTISRTAKQELSRIIAAGSADGEPAVVRLDEQQGQLYLRTAPPRPQDVVVPLNGSAELCIDERLAHSLGERRLELLECVDGSRAAVLV